jgi:membrane protease YdiL (CAAX protease family)
MRPLLLGLLLTVALFALFHYAGPLFFLDTTAAFQANFVAGGLFGLALGLATPWLAGRPRGRAVRATALILAPLLLVMAAVGSHFAVFFPALDPALDKVFGSWMLWVAGFALIGALVVEGRG